jgi:ArsR family transcriptional regulator
MATTKPFSFRAKKAFSVRAIARKASDPCAPVRNSGTVVSTRSARSITAVGRNLVPVFKALADETRITIVRMLADAAGEVCACEIEAKIKELSQPTVSHHLKVLRDAGVVTSERRGTWVYYSLDIAFIKSMNTWSEWVAAKHQG